MRAKRKVKERKEIQEKEGVEWREKERKRRDKLKNHRKTDVGRRDTKQLQDFLPNAYNPIAIT